MYYKLSGLSCKAENIGCERAFGFGFGYEEFFYALAIIKIFLQVQPV